MTKDDVAYTAVVAALVAAIFVTNYCTLKRWLGMPTTHCAAQACIAPGSPGAVVRL